MPPSLLFRFPLLSTLLLTLLTSLLLIPSATAYQLTISSSDPNRQVCTGMWGGGKGRKRDPWIEVVFSPSDSAGQVALIIYEWKDAKWLGVDPTGTAPGKDLNRWEKERIYICTPLSVSSSLCDPSSLGQFIISPSIDKPIDQTSIWTQSIHFDPVGGEKPPIFRRQDEPEQIVNSSAPFGSTLSLGPFRYPVPRTGYYCVGAVPLLLDASTTQAGGTAPGSIEGIVEGLGDARYQGTVGFENVFEGYLPASEYPKVLFYSILILVYLVLGLVWGYTSWKYKEELLPIQHYVSGTIGFLVLEMFSIWGYYAYINKYGNTTFGHTLLVVVAVLNAVRNSLSFFMLLLVSMGYGIVKPSLGGVMKRVKILTGAHFGFGVLYAIGMVVVPLEDAGYLIFFIVFPLALTLTAFMMWIMYSLNKTISDLAARRQTYKKLMFTRLYRILAFAVLVIFAFFIISSISFSNRLDEDYAPATWKTRWFLLDGWLGLLYLLVFCSIAYLWRPTAHNRRLAMSEELATDEDSAAAYDLQRLSTASDGSDEENKGAPLRRGTTALQSESVVFDIGEDEDDEEGGVGAGGSREEGRPLRSGNRNANGDGPPPYEGDGGEEHRARGMMGI